MNVCTVNRSMATGSPATAEGQAGGMIPAADENFPARRRSRHLRVAAETQI